MTEKPEGHAMRYARRFELNLRCYHAIQLLDEALGLSTDTLLELYRELTSSNVIWSDTDVQNLLDRVAPREKEREMPERFHRTRQNREAQEPHEFSASIVKETDKAYLLDFGGRQMEWFPKSKTQLVKEGKGSESDVFECPQWLAERRGLYDSLWSSTIHPFS